MEDNKLSVIDAEYREIGEEPDTLCEITAEIRIISEQINRMLLSGIVEIGKRFEKAKSLVKRGKWGEYCEQCTGYKKSMAENYIKMYKEYKDLVNSQSIGNLGISKLMELAAIPADEREQFAIDNDAESLTVRKLRELITKQREDDKAITDMAADREDKLKSEIRDKQRQIEDKEKEIGRLTEELMAAEKTAGNSPAQDEMAAMIAAAEASVREEMQREITSLQKDITKEKNAADKLQKKLDKLRNSDEKIKELEGSLSEEVKKSNELEAEISRIKKEAELGSNEKFVRLNLCFESAQNSIAALTSALDAIRDSEKYDKLRTAIGATLRGLIPT